MTTRPLIRSVLIGFSCAAVLVACKDSGPQGKGPPSKLLQIGSGPFTAFANTELSNLQISVRDDRENTLADQTVTFTVTAGGGSIASATAMSDANGTVTVPPWKLGRSKIPQTLRATIGTITLDISAEVKTDYKIEVRFWGSTTVSPANQALFTAAAARLMATVTGDIQDVMAANFDLAECNVVGQPNLNEVIDDVIIYAAVQPIDGGGGPSGNILARSGPCAGRPTTSGWHTAIGVMEFDSFDFANLAAQGSLQDVVIHEMLHALGHGVFWDAEPTAGRNLLQGVGSGDPRYTGTQGVQGCVTVGGTTTCATSIPVENVGGAGSENSHWRDATFGNELMTSLLNTGSNPLSSMTVASLVDLGFVVNSANNDAYSIPGGAIRANASVLATPSRHWEQVLQPLLMIDRDGQVRRLRPRS